VRIDLGEMVSGIQQRLSLITSPDKAARELLDILRDTHRILVKLETMVDRLDETAREWEGKLQGVDLSPQRFERLEKAVFNIERATLGVEASMSSLPRVLRTRIDRRRLPAAGGPGAGPDWGQEPPL